MYVSADAAKEAEAEFDKIFINKGIPDDIPEYQSVAGVSEIGLLALIVEVKFAASNGEARRLVQQGGVSIDGEKVSDPKSSISLDAEKILKYHLISIR